MRLQLVRHWIFSRGLEDVRTWHQCGTWTSAFAQWDAVEGCVQVLTLCLPPIEQMATGTQAVDLARMANDRMAELVRRYPERFLGFAASLPVEDPDASLREIDRAIGDLGALGVQIFTNSNGRAMDDPRFE